MSSGPLLPGGGEGETEAWLYHLPALLDQLRDQGRLDLRDAVGAEVGGFLYHHRGARLAGPEARFVDEGDAFLFELSPIGDRVCRARFDMDRAWDFYLLKMHGDQPVLAWMTDAELTEDGREDKADAVGAGMFSFGVYLEAPGPWELVRDRSASSDAPLFLLRPTGRTYVPPPDFDLDHEMVPPELRPGGGEAPDHLGLVDVEMGRS